jgi:hypothetical protein
MVQEVVEVQVLLELMELQIQTGGNGGAGTASSITGSSVTRAGGGGGGELYEDGTCRYRRWWRWWRNCYIWCSRYSRNSKYRWRWRRSGYGPSFHTAGAGGKGVVILSVPTANYSGTTTGSPTVTTSGANTILQFNGSGSYTT